MENVFIHLNACAYVVVIQISALICMSSCCQIRIISIGKCKELNIDRKSDLMSYMHMGKLIKCF